MFCGSSTGSFNVTRKVCANVSASLRTSPLRKSAPRNSANERSESRRPLTAMMLWAEAFSLPET